EPSPAAAYCEAAAVGCAAGQSARRCFGAAVPSDPYLTGCALAPEAGATPDDRTYCCTYVPHCTNFGSCGDSGINVQCNDPVVPQAMDPALHCATLFASVVGASSYCCTREELCLETGMVSCSDAGVAYACTGDAAPSGLACASGPNEDAGAKGVYCCAPD